MIRNIIWN